MNQNDYITFSVQITRGRRNDQVALATAHFKGKWLNSLMKRYLTA